MVSPLYKGGFGATHIEAVASDGDGVAFFSPGEFAGAPAGFSNNANGLDYLSRRQSGEWSTVPIMPPDQVAPFVNYHDINSTLSAVLALVKPGTSIESASVGGAESEFLVHETEALDVGENWGILDTGLKTLTNRQVTLEYLGTSANFCHVLLMNAEEGSEEKYQLLKLAIGVQHPVYELSRGCNGESAALRLVSLNDQGKPISPACASESGLYKYDTFAANSYNSISTDGSEIFFTTCVDNEVSDHQLFVRLGGTRTVEVSRPIDPHIESCGINQIPCPKAIERPSADFAGASENGSRVFFTTTAPLVGEDKDVGEDLYMAEIGCPPGQPECSVSSRRVIGLTQVSHSSGSVEANVKGVVRVAPDGSRAYFVATGDLLSPTKRGKLEGEGRPTPSAGGDNLYVYDVESKELAFIGDLCSGYESSGSTVNSHCTSRTGVDTKLWTGLGEHEVQTAGIDGRFLIFASYAQLNANDADAAKDVYRYDAQTGTVERVSIGEAGYSSNGNGEFAADISNGHLGESLQLQYELGSRASSEDGSRIVFTTAEPLSPGATNGLANVYEWHEAPGDPEGAVTLISGGSGETPADDPVIAPEGNDIFFVTTEGLVQQDTDGLADIYDARIDGGFPERLASREPCSSDACQGPLTNPVPVLAPESSSPGPAEKLASTPTPAKSTKAKRKSGKKKPKKKRLNVKGGKAGRVKAGARAKRSSKLAAGKRS